MELFNARTIGTLPGYILADHLRALPDTDSRTFILTEPLRKVLTVISKKVYMGQDDLVSANHCQPGGEGDTFGVKLIKVI